MVYLCAQIRANPYVYEGRPRLKTAYELLMISLDIEKWLHEVPYSNIFNSICNVLQLPLIMVLMNYLMQVSLPFLIVHGEADRVTDPSVSKLLYASAKSVDRTLKLYPNMWHGLTFGEPPENTELVFSDIIAWLGKRSEAVGGCHVEKNERLPTTAYPPH